MSESAIETCLREVADWHVFDANVRMGRSGIHGGLALEPPELVVEMDRNGIEQALISHFTAVEYDAFEGNTALAQAVNQRLVPCWAALPETDFIKQLDERKPAAVRLYFAPLRHNFSPAPWCSGELCSFLQDGRILTLIAAEDIGWEALANLLENFPGLHVLLLEAGYRADRYLFPLLRKFPNLYFDSSTYLGHRQLECFVERFGPERIVFGSRLPLYTPGAALAVLATARISDQNKRAIGGGNLRSLLESSEQ
ncbi:MAG: amidohydrolase [Acidobacteria bacterium]|nr:amidohydrolase [Acidobacteriota bacterium]